MHLKPKQKPSLSKYLRLVIYSHLSTVEYIEVISRLSRNERESVMDSGIASSNRHANIRVPDKMCLCEHGDLQSTHRRKLVEMVNQLSSVTINYDFDFVGKCDQHKPHEQLVELLCTLPSKFDDRKVSLKLTDKRGVLRLDRFQKIMLDRRQSM